MPVTYVNSDASNSGNVTAISGLNWVDTNAGDIAFFIGALINSATPVVDSDFNLIRTDIDQNLECWLGQRAPASMTGTETGAITMTVGGTETNRMAAAIAAYRGASGIGTVTRAVEGTTAVTTHAGPSVSLASADDAIVLVYTERQSLGWAVDAVTPPAGYTKRVEWGTGGSGGTVVCIADKLSDNSAGSQATGSWSSANAASNCQIYAIPVTAAAGSANQGTLVASFSAAVAEMTGDASVSAELIAAFSAAVASMTGDATADGTLAASFSSPVAAFAGDGIIDAVLTGTFSGPSFQVDGVTSAAGQLGGAFSTPTLDADAIASTPGSLVGSFSSPTADVTGSGNASGLLAGVFAAVEASFAGQSLDAVNRGQLAGSFAAVEFSAAGRADSVGQIVGTFAAPVSSLSGDASAQGTIIGTFSAATMSIAGSISGVPRDVEVVILHITEVGVEVQQLDEALSVTIVKSTDVFTTIGGIDMRDQWRKGTKEFIDFVATIRDRAGEMTLAEAEALNYKIAVTAGDEVFPDEPTDVRFVVPSVAPVVVQAEENGVDIPGQFDVTIRHLYEAEVTGLHRVWLTFGPTPEEPILLAVTFVSL